MCGKCVMKSTLASHCLCSQEYSGDVEQSLRGMQALRIEKLCCLIPSRISQSWCIETRFYVGFCMRGFPGGLPQIIHFDMISIVTYFLAIPIYGNPHMLLASPSHFHALPEFSAQASHQSLSRLQQGGTSSPLGVVLLPGLQNSARPPGRGTKNLSGAYWLPSLFWVM